MDQADGAPASPEPVPAPEPAAADAAATPPPPKEKSEKKVKVVLKSIGDAPVLAKKASVLFIKPQETMATFTATMRRYIKIQPQDSLFFYVKSCFSPSLDTTFETLIRCFAQEAGKEPVVELQYSITPAWG
ncbi:CBN-LGG-3 protein [Caenorhabditis brenneri]|uniref:CBN-LGG-3 protein n=1 Tax=Caenorhabditis brenneri TaxID=135651 RepID=G0MPG8_CAEBE|nr:CBN-LGG-3 protein [Caenorhabditis brenneri]